ncbi:MAG: LysE family translocator [Pseudomonadota bacterium]
MLALNLALAPLALFVLVSSITPGPNNLLVMRSGARFGLQPTTRHILGVETGMVGLLLLAHIGLGALLLALPMAFEVLRWACFGYLLYLAWVTLRDPGPSAAGSGASAQPMGFTQAALFQLVNPKAWMMAVTGVSAFNTAGSPGAGDLAAVIAVFLAIGFPCVMTWALWGAAIHRVLHKASARRVFNISMAVLVAGSAVLMLQS